MPTVYMRVAGQSSPLLSRRQLAPKTRPGRGHAALLIGPGLSLVPTLCRLPHKRRPSTKYLGKPRALADLKEAGTCSRAIAPQLQSVTLLDRFSNFSFSLFLRPCQDGLVRNAFSRLPSSHTLLFALLHSVIFRVAGNFMSRFGGRTLCVPLRRRNLCEEGSPALLVSQPACSRLLRASRNSCGGEAATCSLGQVERRQCAFQTSTTCLSADLDLRT